MCQSEKWKPCLKYFVLIAWLAQDSSSFPPLFLSLLAGPRLGPGLLSFWGWSHLAPWLYMPTIYMTMISCSPPLPPPPVRIPVSHLPTAYSTFLLWYLRGSSNSKRLKQNLSFYLPTKLVPPLGFPISLVWLRLQTLNSSSTWAPSPTHLHISNVPGNSIDSTLATIPHMSTFFNAINHHNSLLVASQMISLPPLFTSENPFSLTS